MATTLLCGPIAQAQTANTGFSLNRFEPTAAGEWSFGVNHPWYSSMRYFAGGITLNYAHNPLVFSSVNADGSSTRILSVVEHQLLAHVDLAGSFLDRILITASLPIVLLERGNSVSDVGPVSGVVVSDPRLGIWARLYGQPYKSAFSISLGGDVWLPLRAFGASTGVAPTSSDEGIRILPKAVLGGLTHHVMWSFTAGFLYRPSARLSQQIPDAGSSVGSELQIGAAVAYADTDRRFAVGPEMLLGTTVIGTDASKPFNRDFTSLELLLGAHYNIANTVNVSLGGGVGVLRTPGTPDGRVLLRIAYAPMKKEAPKDTDKDGIPDYQDACPNDAGLPSDDSRTHGCPDRDRDGIVDKFDLCPDTPKGPTPEPKRLGCPAADRDKDGVFDFEDECPDTAKGDKPDPKRLGCPADDRDKDGVVDFEDQCPDTPKGDKPDPTKPGCPAGDRDKDGVFDHEDQCPEVPMGLHPDPAKPGCPLPDRDHDEVVDSVDACPDQPGAPSADPKKNGCPGLVTISGGQIKILAPVFFATRKDVILKKSFPVLESVSAVLKQMPVVKKVGIEGHTDDRGKPDFNRDLSLRRAQSVMSWLIKTGGIEANRLEAKGFGPDRPIADNATNQGREKNRRVDFVILDPAAPEGIKTMDAKQAVVPVSPDQSDKGKTKATDKTDAKEPADDGKGKGRHHRKKGKKGEADSAAADSPAAADEDKGGKKRHHRKKDKADKADKADSAAAADDAGGKKKHHRKKAKAE